MTVVSSAPVHAATITSATDIVDSLQVSVGSDHLVTFTTPSGAAEGDTITLTFGSDYDTASITEDDIDISDDAVDLTTAPDCTGTEEAGVSIASDVITIEICSGDGGAIAASSEVVIEVGENATASGTGLNTVVNPSVSGVYYVSVAGTFGDEGTIAHPILTSGSGVSVTGSITAGAEESEDPTEDVDSTAPTISNVTVSGITSSEATITWTTSEPANSSLDYGLEETFGTTEESLYVFVTSHSISLSGLDEAMTYYFQVRSSDASDNEGTSLGYSFTTLDVTAPVISDLAVSYITYDSAVVTWVTDEDATTQLNYGTTDSYVITETVSGYSTDHSITLSGLSALTEYHFAVTSEDSSYNIAISSDETFTTLENFPPENVSDLAISEYSQALVLSWVNPSDEDFAGVYSLYCEDDFPSSVTDVDCVELFDLTGAETTFTHLDLDDATVYYYGLFAYDRAGQYASGALASGTTLPPDTEDTDDETDETDETGETPAEEDETDSESETDSTDSTGSSVVCGDGYCAGGESYSTCPLDCSPEEVSEGSGSQELFATADFNVLAAENSINLLVTTSGYVRALVGTSVHVMLLTGQELDNIEYLMIDIDDEMFLLSYSEEDAAYVASITTPPVEDSYDFTLVKVGTDGSKEFRSFMLTTEAYGYAYETIDGQETEVQDVVFTLFNATGEMGMWNASEYYQTNPFTSVDGRYGWYVPIGTYYVRAEKDGYEIAQTGAFRAGDSLINKFVEMHAIATAGQEDIATEDQEVIVEEVEVTILDVIGLDTEAFQDVSEMVKVFIEAPVVQEVAEISVPALAITAGASLIVMGIAFDFLPFLQYLFTAPFLFLWRRKRKGFGVVYNALRKTPIDLATVRLYKFETKEAADDLNQRGKLVKSRVTDKFGRYFFLVQQGYYRLTVTKSGYTYPTTYLADQSEDGAFLDVYHAEPIVVTEKDAIISANIPLDPQDLTEAQAIKKTKNHGVLRKAQAVLSFSGVFAAVIFALIRPHLSAYIMIGVQVLVYLFVRRLAKPRKPSSWGIVYDKYTGRPLTNVVARIFEPKFNRLIETQVTDGKGRYSFLLGPNQYFARFEKPGFRPLEVRPIDLMQLQGANDFAINIGLDPDTGQQAPPPPQQSTQQ